MNRANQPAEVRLIQACRSAICAWLVTYLHDLTIAELAHAIAKVVGYRGRIEFDAGKPDGVPRKLLDSAKAKALGWRPRIAFEDGLDSAYRAFLQVA